MEKTIKTPLVMADFSPKKQVLEKVGADGVRYKGVPDYYDGKVRARKMELLYDINQSDGGDYQFDQQKSLLFLITYTNIREVDENMPHVEILNPKTLLIKSVEFVEGDFDGFDAKYESKRNRQGYIEKRGLMDMYSFTIYEEGIDNKESFFALLNYISNLLYPHSGILNRGIGFKQHPMRIIDLGNRLDAYEYFSNYQRYDIEHSINKARLFFRNQ